MNQIRNPKHEIRNKRNSQIRNPKIESGNELVWNFLLFYHLNLFRISDFEFRIFSHLLSFAAARRRLMAATTPSPALKTADPATSTLAPASTTSGAPVASMPPSTSRS